MSLEIGAEAALFPEKEYINAIDVAVHMSSDHVLSPHKLSAGSCFKVNRVPALHACRFSGSCSSYQLSWVPAPLSRDIHVSILMFSVPSFCFFVDDIAIIAKCVVQI